MKRFVIVLALFVIGMSWLELADGQAAPAHAELQQDYAQLKAQAERYFAEQSFAKASELYAQVDASTLPPGEQRWVTFRRADARWRALAGSNTFDATTFDETREQLESLINAIKRVEDRDQIWAEANESLGDWWWTRPQLQNWGEGWRHYQHALDWWAGSSDLETARRRYLGMVWKVTWPEWLRARHYLYRNVPLQILDNALMIATEPKDKARAHFLIANALRSHGGDWVQQQRIAGEFEAAIQAGKTVDWYDDALYSFAQWLMSEGRPVLKDNGQWTRERDYIAALAVFQRLLREFRKGESRHYDDAMKMVKYITEPSLQVSVSNIFLPGSEVQFHLNWRNVPQIELSLHKVSLTRDVNITNASNGAGDWQNHIDLSAAEKIRSWTKPIEDQGDYQPGQAMERLEHPLETGAYILSAAAAGVNARTLLLVSDAAIIVKASGDALLAFVCDALTSAPIANASVRIWRYHHDQHWMVSDLMRTTDAQGLCVLGQDEFPAVGNRDRVQYLVTMNADDRQAFATTYGAATDVDHREWRIYAFTDRPAYRPEETVQWKFIARNPASGGYATPANQSIKYIITDPQGSTVEENMVELNSFGSAWGALELSASMPLGEYAVEFLRPQPKDDEYIGSATLFRLEEYKLPEFRVAINTPQVDGKPRAFVLGESVDVEIEADYYFGGPVANGTVEIVLRQAPYYRWWVPPRDFPWLYSDTNPYRWWDGEQGQIIRNETIRTDAQGKAAFTFQTPAGSPQDFEYHIEARVSDASRREIIGHETIRVTRQRYYVHARAERHLHRPGDKVEVTFNAVDANDQPVPAEGTVNVTREEWIEIWIDPAGREITGDELHEIQSTSRIFPPPPRTPADPAWQMKFRGYRTEAILTTTVQLDTSGKAEFAFTPESIGFYRVSWFSKDQSPVGVTPINAETAAWVVRNDLSRLGYRSGGLEIIIDKDTVHVGQTMPVMISTPTNDRHVLLAVEGDNLYSHQVVHVTGNVKLVHLPIEPRHIPNAYLTAMLAHAGQLHQDQKEVIVPPVEQYLKVDVVSDREEYQPGEEGHFTVTATDHQGKPIAAEIALAVVDESVAYIQQDYAGDPRAFFFDRRQELAVHSSSTFQHAAYVKLIKTENDKLIDERWRAMAGDRQPRDLKDRATIDGVIEGTETEIDYLARARRGAGMAGQMEGGGGGIFGNASAEMPRREIIKLGVPMEMLKAPASAPMRQDGVADAHEQPAVIVRGDFRSTLLWQPSVITDETGAAKFSLKYADSLTTWSATARAAGTGQQFGMAAARTRTKMPLIARLQAPRFFLVGDSVTVSGVINNNTDEDMHVHPSLEAEGVTIAAMFIGGNPVGTEIGGLTVPANGETRVDWQVNVESPGVAKLKLMARGGKHADAMERMFPAYEHGVKKLIAKSGKVRGDEVLVMLDIPAERKPESTTLTVQIAPSMAVTMLDALPYLIDYPYGCTEQTMSRFLPAAITAKTLNDLGIKPEVVMAKMFGGIEATHAPKTHPKAKKDLNQLDQIVQANLDRLYSFQHGSGGWGWWKDGETDHFMTAYVLWGMCLARDAGLDVRQNAIDRAAAYLRNEIVEREREHDLQAWLLHALAAYHTTMRPKVVGEFEAKALSNLWTNRSRLNAYTRSLLALSAHAYGDSAKAKTLIENLENGVKRDDRPDASVIIKGKGAAHQAALATAHWGDDGLHWRWSEGGVEATAFALRALLAIDPQHPLIEPVTNWLVKNRRGAQWSNTRDTAIVVLTLNDYLRGSGELTSNLEYEILVNGASIASKRLTPEDAFSAPSRIVVEPKHVRAGANEIRLVRRSGNGTLYFAAEAAYFSLEEPVPPAGNELFVRREYYKLVPRRTLLKGFVYDSLPLTDGGTVNSGERVEVVLTVEGKNNYEYLVFEDLKPAGFEAVAVRSGEPLWIRELKSGAVKRTFGDGEKAVETVQAEQAQRDAEEYTGRTRPVYQELRDRQVAMFIDRLPEGVWEMRYDLRAEMPGRFHALPVMGHAMYVPEIRCNGAEVRVTVIDSGAHE